MVVLSPAVARTFGFSFLGFLGSLFERSCPLAMAIPFLVAAGANPAEAQWKARTKAECWQSKADPSHRLVPPYTNGSEV
jgi:hypothetical protein